LMGLWSLQGALSKFKLSSKFFLNILRANWIFLISNFMYLKNPLLWMMWIWKHPNGMEVYPWKFMKSLDEPKFIQEIQSIILFHPLSLDTTCEFKCWTWLPCAIYLK
jgi:hypothetical protein